MWGAVTASPTCCKVNFIRPHPPTTFLLTYVRQEGYPACKIMEDAEGGTG